MKTRYLLATAALMGGAFLALQPAQAGTIPVVWNFMGNTVNLGTTATYTSNPTVSPAQNIVASGYTGPNSTQDLFGKNGGTGEQGLGLTNDPTHDNEITSGSFIQLDISRPDVAAARHSDPELPGGQHDASGRVGRVRHEHGGNAERGNADPDRDQR